MATLQQTWDQSWVDFNTTFASPGPSQSQADSFGRQYYDGNIVVTKPSGAALYGVNAVVNDFKATCPHFKPTHITTMSEQQGKVEGEGWFSDKGHLEHKIHFVFTWAKDGLGNWTVTRASANNKPAPAEEN